MFRHITSFALATGLLWCGFAGAEQLRDPTRPLDYRAGVSAQSPLVLNSILIASDRRLAIINGQSTGEGERIGDVQVIRILPNRVLVRRDGKDIELKLHNSLSRNKAS